MVLVRLRRRLLERDGGHEDVASVERQTAFERVVVLLQHHDTVGSEASDRRAVRTQGVHHEVAIIIRPSTAERDDPAVCALREEPDLVEVLPIEAAQ